MKTYTTDAEGWLCLGKQFANKMFSLKVRQGHIELIPISEKEAWLHNNSKAMAIVQKGLKQAKQGKGKSPSFNLKGDEAWLNEAE